MGKQVKCIDNDGFEGDLILGHVYEIIEVKMFGYQENYRIYDSLGRRVWYRVERFQDIENIEEDEKTAPTLRVPVFSSHPVACDTEKAPAVSYVGKISSDDQDLSFFSKPQQGECPCRRARKGCEYHG